MAVSRPRKLLTACAVPSPEERSMVPVTVLTKTHKTSHANDPTNRTLIIFFACRTHLWSASLVTSDSSSLYSWDVAMTAPATRAAGAPRLHVQSKAPVATSKTSAADAFTMCVRGVRLCCRVSRGPVKAWVAAAISAVRTSMVHVASRRFDGVVCSHSLLQPLPPWLQSTLRLVFLCRVPAQLQLGYARSLPQSSLGAANAANVPQACNQTESKKCKPYDPRGPPGSKFTARRMAIDGFPGLLDT